MSEEKQEVIQEEELLQEQAESAENTTTEAPEEVDQILELKKEIEENYNKYLRVQADFDNFRKRTRKEREDLLKYSSQSIIEALLPAIDNLERALASGNSSTVDSIIKGVEMVHKQISQVLVQEGLSPIESVGKPFDATYHQAVMQEESPEQEAGIVLQELQKGYMLKDRVIRPAMVKVSS